MQLPYLSSNLIAWLDPSERYINKNASLKVVSAINRVSGSSARQLVESKKPLWSATVLNNTPGLLFSSEQRLTINLPSPAISSKSLAIIFAAQFNVSTGNIALELGSSTNPNLVGMGLAFDTGADLVEPYIFADNLSGSVVNASHHLDSNVHVWSIAYNMSVLTVKVDGVVVNQTSMPGVSTFTYDSLTLGDVSYDSDNPVDHFYFAGNIGTVLVYQGDIIHPAAEEFVIKSVRM